MIKTQQTRLLFEALPRSMLAATVVALALAYVQDGVIDRSRVAIWLSMYLLVTVVRFAIWLWFRRHPDVDILRFEPFSLSGALASGLVWGSALFPTWSHVYRLFLAFVLGGMAAGSVAVLSYRREHAWGFVALTLLPITVQWFFLGGVVSVAEGIMALAYGTVLISMASVTSRHSVRALTAEIEAEEVARAAARDRDFLRLVLDTIPARVFWKNRESRYLGGNELFARDAGFDSADEVIGMCDEDLSWRNRAADFRDTDERVMRSGQPMLRFEERAIRANGDYYWREVSKVPILDADNKVIGVLGTYHDITEKLEVEAQLRQAQKLEAIGTLVAGIAHEFNNMLAGITGNLFLARGKVHAGEPQEALEKLGKAEEAGFKAAKMIRQLMTLSRKDQSLISLVPVDLAQWIHEAIELPKASFPATISISLQCEDQPMMVETDTTLLLQMLVNLINNACDATQNQEKPEVRVMLAIETVEEGFKRRHPDFPAEECIRLSVADNGTGIPAAQLERIFEPFYTTKEVGKGTGLGLSIVQGAMQSHRGCIEVESELGKGTVISLFFPPLHQAAAVAQEAGEQAMSIPHGHGETILIADDEPQVLAMLVAVLEELGYRTVTASDGEKALALFEQDPQAIDLVLLDIIMPNMLGTAAAKSIRAKRPDIPLAFCTGYSQEEMRDELNDVGSFRLIGKPFRVSEIGQAVSVMLKGR